MIYLHTSAIVRLAAVESDPLPALLTEVGAAMAVTSELSGDELDRTGAAPDVVRRARTVLDSPSVLTVEVSDLIRESAESLAEDELDPRQAIHLATALSLGAAVRVFACDDPTLGVAATARGMRTAVPPFGSSRHSRRGEGDW